MAETVLNTKPECLGLDGPEFQPFESFSHFLNFLNTDLCLTAADAAKVIIGVYIIEARMAERSQEAKRFDPNAQT